MQWGATLRVAGVRVHVGTPAKEQSKHLELAVTPGRVQRFVSQRASVTGYIRSHSDSMVHRVERPPCCWLLPSATTPQSGPAHAQQRAREGGSQDSRLHRQCPRHLEWLFSLVSYRHLGWTAETAPPRDEIDETQHGAQSSSRKDSDGWSKELYIRPAVADRIESTAFSLLLASLILFLLCAPPCFGPREFRSRCPPSISWTRLFASQWRAPREAARSASPTARTSHQLRALLQRQDFKKKARHGRRRPFVLRDIPVFVSVGSVVRWCTLPIALTSPSGRGSDFPQPSQSAAVPASIAVLRLRWVDQEAASYEGKPVMCSSRNGHLLALHGRSPPSQNMKRHLNSASRRRLHRCEIHGNPKTTYMS